MSFMGWWWMRGWCIIGTVLWMASLRFGYQKNASQLMAPVKSGKWLKIIREICGYDPFLGRMGDSKFRRQ